MNNGEAAPKLCFFFFSALSYVFNPPSHAIFCGNARLEEEQALPTSPLCLPLCKGLCWHQTPLHKHRSIGKG